MNDELFINKLNRITREKKMKLPLPPGCALMSPEALSQWTAFLSSCQQAGITLADPRWRRVKIARKLPYTVFTLEGAADVDAEFRIGLQLLLGAFDENKGRE